MLAVPRISGRLGRTFSLCAIPLKHFVVHLGLPPNNAGSYTSNAGDTGPAVLQESLGLALSCTVLLRFARQDTLLSCWRPGSTLMAVHPTNMTRATDCKEPTGCKRLALCVGVDHTRPWLDITRAQCMDSWGFDEQKVHL